jgi:cell division protein FtsI/penicillin-binding protein 2
MAHMKRHYLPFIVQFPVFFVFIALFLSGELAATTTKSKKKRSRVVRTSVSTSVAVRPALARSTGVATRGVVRGGPWTQPTYADSTNGDNIDGEDLDVRREAVAALGPYNGSIVVVDSSTGRILTMVNQKLALASGFQPCSTIKVSVALAALSEKVVEPQTKLRVGGMNMDLTYALARSNNLFFATLGQKLGFDRLSYYAHLFGYGEKAGLNIPGEQAGRFPAAPPANGGVGMMSSFGEEISQTPLQLAALMSAVANGGTLFYLQYPVSQQDAAALVPRIKRRLDIHDEIPAIKPGMREAVESGTAHRARQDEPIAGKTGTCTENHAHLGWFGSFNDLGDRKLVTVVLLTGGRPVSGPVAAEIAGDFYHRLEEKSYFARPQGLTPAALISRQVTQ